MTTVLTMIIIDNNNDYDYDDDENHIITSIVMQIKFSQILIVIWKIF